LILSKGWIKALSSRNITLPFDFNEISETLLKYHPAIVFGLYLIALIFFVWSLREATLKYQIAQITWTIVCLLLVVGQSHFVIQYLYEGFIWVVVPHGLIMVNDIMAYYCGMALGKKIIARPLTQLSPNKTWEGAIGATFFTVVLGFFLAAPLAQYDWFICPRPSYGGPVAGCQPSYIFIPTVYETPVLFQGLLGKTVEILPIQIHAIFFGLFASIIGPFGGLFASGIKRAYGKKDFDSFIPGHGGIIDRFDCQYLMVTFVYVYLATFVGGGAMKPDQLIYHFSTLLPEEQLVVFNAMKTIMGK